MLKTFLYTIILLSITIIASCSKENVKTNTKSNLNVTPEILYIQASKELDKKNNQAAKISFENIIEKFPLTNEAIQSQIMIGFIEYLQLNYDEAIMKFDYIINKYPSHKNIDYVYYMRAVSYFEQIEKETLDGNNNIEALKNFEKLINRFPSSKYSRDSKQKIIYVKENIAAKHMNIAFFYLKKKQYYAAMGRYQEVIDNYSQSKFIPEALYRLVEIYYNLGMLEDAKKTASVIGFNYPQSKWYNYAYVLLKNNQSKNDMKLIKKFYNFFKINDNKK